MCICLEAIKIANQKFEVKKFLNGEIEVEAEEKVKGGFTMAKKAGQYFVLSIHNCIK